MLPSLPPSLWSLPAALLLSLATHPVFGEPHELSSRTNTVPAPLSIAPAENWEGFDGQWNTFALRVGTPAQVIRVYISTASQQTWVVAPIGCTGWNQTECDSRRGSDFNSNFSSTWTEQGKYELWIESNLGFDKPEDVGLFGYDTVGLGYQGEGGPTLDKQVVGAISTYDFFYGHFGINPKPTNWTADFSDPYPSYITSLKNESQIPSVSWAYTAGAQYRFASILSSLTLGGYDSSRFIPNNLTIPLGSNNERDILPAIQGISAAGNGLSQTNLIPSSFTSPMYAYIDSTVAEIWLPEEVCAVFEQTFNLTYNSTTDLYLIDDNVHQQLLTTNANITFTLGAQPSGGQTVDIVLPYSAFDLTAKQPYRGLKADTRFFPLRRAANSTQYTLGRTFLQEAYLIVDWERRNFSVSQCSWVASASQHLVPIFPVNGTNSGGMAAGASKMTSLGTGAIVGIVVGAAVAASIFGVIVFVMYRRKSKQVQEDDEELRPKTTESEEPVAEEQQSQVIPKAELDATQNPRQLDDGTYYKPGVPDTPVDSDASLTWLNPVEADSKEREIFEMPGDFPKPTEVDGRMMTEKEALRAREERYNGVNPSPSPVTPVSSNDRLRPSPVSPGEVVEVIGRVVPRGNHLLPVSPIDGGSSDGSRTMLFAPLSPMESSNSPDTNRRRFSYEIED